MHKCNPQFKAAHAPPAKMSNVSMVTSDKAHTRSSVDRGCSHSLSTMVEQQPSVARATFQRPYTVTHCYHGYIPIRVGRTLRRVNCTGTMVTYPSTHTHKSRAPSDSIRSKSFSSAISEKSSLGQHRQQCIT